jgi:hypothetical protein
LLQRKWYWYGTLAAWFTAADFIPGSHDTADVVGEDAAILVAIASCSSRTSSSRFKKLIDLL